MPFKSNYHRGRVSRERTKNARRQEKIRKREEAAAQRKPVRETEFGSEKT